jgi:soluble cytochrome b562
MQSPNYSPLQGNISFRNKLILENDTAAESAGEPAVMDASLVVNGGVYVKKNIVVDGTIDIGDAEQEVAADLNINGGTLNVGGPAVFSEAPSILSLPEGIVKIDPDHNIISGLIDTTDVDGLDAALTDLSAAQTAITDIQGDLKTVQDDIGAVETNIEDLQTGLSAVQTAVDDLDTRLETAEGNITETQTAVGDLDTRLETAEGKITTVETAVGDLDTRLETAEGNITETQTAVGDLDTRLETAEGKITTVETAIDAIETNMVTLEGTSQTITGTKIFDISPQLAFLGTGTGFLKLSTNQTISAGQILMSDIYQLDETLQTITSGDSNVSSGDQSIIGTLSVTGMISTNSSISSSDGIKLKSTGATLVDGGTTDRTLIIPANSTDGANIIVSESKTLVNNVLQPHIQSISTGLSVSGSFTTDSGIKLKTTASATLTDAGNTIRTVSIPSGAINNSRVVVTNCSTNQIISSAIIISGNDLTIEPTYGIVFKNASNRGIILRDRNASSTTESADKYIYIPSKALTDSDMILSKCTDGQTITTQLTLTGGLISTTGIKLKNATTTGSFYTTIQDPSVNVETHKMLNIPTNLVDGSNIIVTNCTNGQTITTPLTIDGGLITTTGIKLRSVGANIKENAVNNGNREIYIPPNATNNSQFIVTQCKDTDNNDVTQSITTPLSLTGIFTSSQGIKIGNAKIVNQDNSSATLTLPNQAATLCAIIVSDTGSVGQNINSPLTVNNSFTVNNGIKLHTTGATLKDRGVGAKDIKIPSNAVNDCDILTTEVTGGQTVNSIVRFNGGITTNSLTLGNNVIATGINPRTLTFSVGTVNSDIIISNATSTQTVANSLNITGILNTTQGVRLSTGGALLTDLGTGNKTISVPAIASPSANFILSSCTGEQTITSSLNVTTLAATNFTLTNGVTLKTGGVTVTDNGNSIRTMSIPSGTVTGNIIVSDCTSTQSINTGLTITGNLTAYNGIQLKNGGVTLADLSSGIRSIFIPAGSGNVVITGASGTQNITSTLQMVSPIITGISSNKFLKTPNTTGASIIGADINSSDIADLTTAIVTTSGDQIIGGIKTFNEVIFRDSLFKLADGNTMDMKNIGFYAQYYSSNLTSNAFCGLHRNNTSKSWELYHELLLEPDNQTYFSTLTYAPLIVGNFNANGNSTIGGTLGVTGLVTAAGITASGTSLITTSTAGIRIVGATGSTTITDASASARTITIPSTSSGSFVTTGSSATQTLTGGLTSSGLITASNGITVGGTSLITTSTAGIRIVGATGSTTITDASASARTITIPSTSSGSFVTTGSSATQTLTGGLTSSGLITASNGITVGGTSLITTSTAGIRIVGATGSTTITDASASARTITIPSTSSGSFVTTGSSGTQTLTGGLTSSGLLTASNGFTVTTGTTNISGATTITGNLTVNGTVNYHHGCIFQSSFTVTPSTTGYVKIAPSLQTLVGTTSFTSGSSGRLTYTDASFTNARAFMVTATLYSAFSQVGPFTFVLRKNNVGSLTTFEDITESTHIVYGDIYTTRYITCIISAVVNLRSTESIELYIYESPATTLNIFNYKLRAYSIN